MGATDYLHTITAAVLWAVVLSRLRMAAGGRPQISLWAALASLACAQSLQIEPVYLAVDQASGVPGGAAVAKHLLALVSAGGVLVLLMEVAGRGSSTRRLALPIGLTLVAMLAPLTFAHGGPVAAPLRHRAEFYSARWPWLVHWGAFLVCLSWALVDATRLCFRYARHAARGPVRTGLHLIGLGTAVGLNYVPLKVIVILLASQRLSDHLVRADRDIEVLVVGCSITLIAIGSGYEAVSPKITTVLTNLSMRRSLGRLRVLWAAVYEAAPYIALAPGTLNSLLGARFSTQDRLYRRVVEIRDGVRALGPYGTPQVRQCAYHAATTAGKPPTEAAAIAEAVWLRVAIAAKARGGAVARVHLHHRVLGGGDLSEEVGWLERVAAAHAHSPLVATLAREYGDLEPQRREAG